MRTVDDILDQYGGLGRIRPRASVEDAKRETNAGLKSNSKLEHLQWGKANKSRVSITHYHHIPIEWSYSQNSNRSNLERPVG
jgi:hypothetical protein